MIVGIPETRKSQNRSISVCLFERFFFFFIVKKSSILSKIVFFLADYISNDQKAGLLVQKKEKKGVFKQEINV